MTLRQHLQASRDRNQQTVANQAEKILDDRRWDGLRTRHARVALVAAFLVIVASVPVVHVSAGSTAGLVAVLLGAALWVGLRLSVRTIADLPEEYLDERQVAVRNASYVASYRWLSAVVVAIASSGLVAFIVLGQDPDTWSVQISWDLAMGLFWALLGLALAIPSMVLALEDRV